MYAPALCVCGCVSCCLLECSCSLSLSLLSLSLSVANTPLASAHQKLPVPCSLREALTVHLDIAAPPRKAVLRVRSGGGGGGPGLGFSVADHGVTAGAGRLCQRCGRAG
jgi:hypothetical protein